MTRAFGRPLAGACSALLLAATCGLAGAAQEGSLPVSIGYEAPLLPDAFPLRLAGAGDGPPAALRLVQAGRPVAVVRPGVPAPDLAPGVYSVIGRGPGGAALFSYKVMPFEAADGAGGDVGRAPLIRLVAPPTDWPVARGLVQRRFPQVFPDPLPGWYADPATAAAAPFSPPLGVPGAGVPGSVPAPVPQALPGRTIARRTAAAATVRRRMAGVPAGAMGTLRNLDSGFARPVADADVYVISGGAVTGATRTDREGNFTVPEGLTPGVHTITTVSPTGASIVGMRVLPGGGDIIDGDAFGGETEAELVVRPVAFRVRRQGPAFSVAEVPAGDLPVALGSLEDGPPVGFPPPGGGPGFGGGGGIGGGGAGGAAGGGGGLLGALIGAGVGAGIAAAVVSDDGDALQAQDVLSPNGNGRGGGNRGNGRGNGGGNGTGNEGNGQGPGNNNGNGRGNGNGNGNDG